MNLWENAINGLSEAAIARHIEEIETIKEAADTRRIRRRRLLPFAWLAACLALLIWGIPWLYERMQSHPQWESHDYRAIWTKQDRPKEIASALMRSYRTRLTGSPYEAYVLTKVTEPALVGGKLMDVTAQGAWVYYGINSDTGVVQLREPNPEETESLRGEIFAIKGVDPALAVCARFSDRGDALTTEHSYTFLNPALPVADLQDFWDGFVASERLMVYDGISAVYWEEVKGKKVADSRYDISAESAEQIRTALLSLRGERTTEDEEAFFVGCRRRLHLSISLPGGFEGRIILYESGYLRLIMDEVYYTPETPLLFRVSKSKVAEIMRIIESQGRLYEPDAYDTVIATTATIAE